MNEQLFFFSVFHLAAQFERVDLLPLLAERLVQATQVVAHRAQLVFVATLSGGQLILRGRPPLKCEEEKAEAVIAGR